MSLENSVRKGQIGRNKQLLLFKQFSGLLENFPAFLPNSGLSSAMGECNTILSAHTKYRHLG